MNSYFLHNVFVCFLIIRLLKVNFKYNFKKNFDFCANYLIEMLS